MNAEAEKAFMDWHVAAHNHLIVCNWTTCEEAWNARGEHDAQIVGALHHPNDEIYKPYGRCAPECMAIDYADAIRGGA